MKKVKFNHFGQEQEIYFNIARLAEVEKLTGHSIGYVIKNQDLDINSLAAWLMVGLRHDGGTRKNQQYYLDELQRAIENGVDINDIQQTVIKAIAGSGILGKQAYYQMFPEEKTAKVKKELEVAEKN